MLNIELQKYPNSFGVNPISPFTVAMTLKVLSDNKFSMRSKHTYGKKMSNRDISRWVLNYLKTEGPYKPEVFQVILATSIKKIIEQELNM